MYGGAARRPRGTRRCRTTRTRRWRGWSARRAVASTARLVMEVSPRKRRWKRGGGEGGGNRLISTPHHGRTGAAAKCGGRRSQVGAGNSVGIVDVLIGDNITLRVRLLQLPGAHADDIRSYTEGPHAFETTWSSRETSPYQSGPQPLYLYREFQGSGQGIVQN